MTENAVPALSQFLALGLVTYTRSSDFMDFTPLKNEPSETGFQQSRYVGFLRQNPN
ncbi:hypothetical protein [Methanogenium cariaci]|jgi:hypothetical protein